MKQLNKIAFIKKYFNGELTESEVDVFNKMLEEDESFSRDVEQYEFVFGTSRFKSRDNSKHDGRIGTRGRWFGITFNKPVGLALLLVFCVSVVVTIQNESFYSDVDSNTLFNEYFEPYPNIVSPTTRSTVVDSNSSIHVALAAYDAANYTDAITLLGEIQVGHQHDDVALFYRAMALMATNQSNLAIKSLKKIRDGSMLENQKNWYLALAYIQSSDISMATDVLESIIQDESYYLIYAQEMLVKLSPENE